MDRSPADWAILPIKRYAQFSGRAPRAEYWWFTLAYLVVGFAFDAVDWAIGSEVGVLGLLFTFALLVPSISVGVRRLHDIDYSGWWLLAALIPAIWIGYEAIYAELDSTFNDVEPSGSMMLAVLAFGVVCIALLVGMVVRGTEGPNRYGPDPYGPAGSDPNQLESVPS